MTAVTDPLQPPPTPVVLDAFAAAQSESPALLVLADPELLRCITSFVIGWPLLIHEFQRDVVPTYDFDPPKKDVRDFVKRVYFPKRVGMFPHIAIAEDNGKVLEMLFHMNKLSYYQTCPQMYFGEVMRCTAFYGRLELLKWVHRMTSRYPEWTWEEDLMKTAIRCDEPDLELLDWLYSHCPSESIVLTSDEASRQAELGNLTVLRWLHDHGYLFSSSTMDEAAKHGHLDIVRFLHEQRTEGCTPAAMNHAARNGHFDVLLFLHENREEGCTVNAMNWSAKRNHFAILKFLHENRSEGCSTDAMDDAAWEGHLEVVQFLHENRSEGCTTDAMDYAAWGGRMDVLRFLHENRSEGCTSRAMDNAAQKNHLESVQFLHENRSEGCTLAGIESCAKLGHMDMVKYLLEHNCCRDGIESTAGIMEAAATAGHMEIVRYLHEHHGADCSSPAAVVGAAGNDHLDVIQFFHENYPDAFTAEVMENAAWTGQFEIVKFLHENRSEGCTSNAMHYAAANGHFDIVKYLHEHRTEGCMHNTMDRAAEGGYLDIVKFLHEHYPESCTSDAIAAAIVNSHLDVARFLHENRAEGFTDMYVNQLSPDAIKFLCVHRSSDILPEILASAVQADLPYTVKVLCEFSNKGCLLEARQLALEKGFGAVAQVLTGFIAHDIESCSLAEHSEDGPRRCQTNHLKAFFQQ